MTALVRVAVRVPAPARESAIAQLLPLAPRGFEEVERGEEVELAAYVDPAGEAAIRSVFEAVEATAVEPGWEDAWRAFHRPVRAGGVWLGPPWEAPPAGEPAVVVDPGRAFGTGSHPTTRLCLELLAEVARGSLIDVGCGSGVLAIAGAKLGFGLVIALDDDPIAVQVARANVAANGVVVDVRLGDATTERLPRADVVVANIGLAVVERVLARLDVRDAITAGYLGAERPAARGWSSVARRELDGWAADHFRAETV